ncbi:MAG: TonB family protein [Pseudomonadales bacterium]|nr:TonB family protein [Pseudomonadales bacterium]
MIFRLFLTSPFAIVTTFGLFYFMQALIATGDNIEQVLRVVRIVDATMPEIVQELIEEIEKPEPLQELEIQPQENITREIDLSAGPNLNIQRAGIEIDTAMEIGNAGINAADGDYLPLVRVPPQYPTRALQRGIEGWALLEFTVNGRGDVVEESIEVIDAEPPDIFNRSAIRAVSRFKYQPRIVDGVGVDVPNVQTVLRYQIEAD